MGVTVESLFLLPGSQRTDRKTNTHRLALNTFLFVTNICPDSLGLTAAAPPGPNICPTLQRTTASSAQRADDGLFSRSTAEQLGGWRRRRWCGRAPRRPS